MAPDTKMTLLANQKCLSCGSPLHVVEAWRRAGGGGYGLFARKARVACSNCRAVFVIRQGRSVAVSSLLLMGAVSLGIAAGLKKIDSLAGLPPLGQLLAVISALLPIVILDKWLAPRLLSVRPLGVGTTRLTSHVVPFAQLNT